MPINLINYLLMGYFNSVVLLGFMLSCTFALKGVEVAQLFNVDTFQCFIRNGAQYAMV